MARFTFVALALLAITVGFTQAGGDKDFRVAAQFTKDDPKDPQRGGPSQTHVVPLKAGKTYTIDMVSTDVDSFLRLLDEKGKQLEEDDDSGGNLNARIVFACTKDGSFKVVCTTFGAPDTLGSYTLTVKSSAAVQPPGTAHARMIGAAAPDLRGDFAVNGSAVKLSELKGKVVLLDFCDVRSSQSAALLSHLSRWHKAYQAKGLAIVAITFYTSDINPALAFDKDAGKIVTIQDADHQSDRVLLGVYAAHHKIEHLLLALPKKDALAAYDAYAINGVPQLVLIDRKGMVRQIDVGGEKSVPQVESELKKLLAEK